MEFGPRALGNRSILADPRRADIRDILNLKIKHRELFRPFAPAVVEEKASEYFEMANPSPFMLKVFVVKNDKKSIIPAVTHVDGTARVQTVSKETQPLFWQLLIAYGKETGIPIILNTSFNENEPIVCTPKEALDCFLKTKMDILVLGHYFLERS
jgi:carbamoyltransferase